MRSAHTNRSTRSKSTRSAHTARSRHPRTVSARGSHSTGRAPRATVPCNLQTAPAAAHGYSMAEVLATVAIIVILCAIVVMNVVSFQANLRQKELDAKAEIIYTAAQEQMTRIMASGREGTLAAPAKGNLKNNEPFTQPPDGTTCYYETIYGVRFIPTINAIPGDMAEDDSVGKWQTCYITSDSLNIDGTTASAANLLFGNGGLDDELLNGNWVIEYDCKSLTVHAVYYSEDFNCASATDGYPNPDLFPRFNYDLRNHALRLDSAEILKADKHVGYHGGGSSSANASFDLEPTIQVVNAEKLTATITCSKPLVYADLAFLVTITDSYGNTNQAYYCMPDDTSALAAGNTTIPVYQADVATNQAGPNAKLSRGGLVYTLQLTLDSLENAGTGDDAEALRFTRIYGTDQSSLVASTASNNASGNQPLVEGSLISISAQVICKRNPLVDTGYAGPVTANSLFDDTSTVPSAQAGGTSTDGIARVSYGRHLQNLDASSGVATSYWRSNGQDVPYFTAAEQIAALDFSRDTGDTKGWASTYGAASTERASYFNGLDSSSKPRFKPIKNDKLVSFNGKPASAASAYSIARLNINEAGNAGLFASAKGSDTVPVTLSNIVLTGSTIKGGANVGGLVGANDGKLIVNNCQLYLNPSTDVTTATNEKDPWLEGAIVGGLVGSNNGTLDINYSSASTVEQGGSAKGGSAGGLVGMTGGTPLTITNSYADSYLTANQTGGLVGSAGTTPVVVKGSYAAGYLGGAGSDSVAAGLVNGVANITSSYTATTAFGTLPGAFFRTSQGGDHDAVCYLNTEVKLEGGSFYSFDNPITTDSSFTDANSPATLLGMLRSADDPSASSSFTLNGMSLSKPYNLMKQGLSSYNWPTVQLPDADGTKLVHYGDWPAGFQRGSLVYFEKYRIVGEDAATSGVCYGFEGANVTTTLVNASKYEDGGSLKLYTEDGALIPAKDQDIIVVGDGYGVVYDTELDNKTTIPVTLRMPEAGKTHDQWTPLASGTIDKDTTKYTVYSSSDVRYYVYRLDRARISNTGYVNAQSYYLGLDVGVGEGMDTYFFNPHFAKTVRRASINEHPVAPEKDDYIFLRTGRQLNNLSLYYTEDGFDVEGGYRSVTRERTFSQQRDIAFTDYDWKNFSTYPQVNGKVVVTSQEPIGTSSGGDAAAKSFVATYDGGCYKITDVSFVSESSDYVGMFGYVDGVGKIQNVVLCTDYKPVVQGAESSEDALESLSHNYYVQRIGALQANEEVHMGILAGYSKGRIENCAAAGYYLAGSDGTVHAYANSTAHIGGLVGTNTGTILRCSADSPKLRLSLYEATTYAAGFVGTNASSGTITNCYALGAIDVVDAKGGKAAVAGFAGNNQGVIDNCYCATAIASSGSGTSSYGFAPAGGRVTNSVYLNGGTYSYITRMYPYNFNTSNNYTSGSPITYSKLKQKASSAPVTAENSFVHSQTRSETGNVAYPYRGVVKNASGQYVHYGNWQDDVVLGTLGIFYWEYEDYGSNNGYHMTYLGSREQTDENGNRSIEMRGGSSLCNSHDDGGVITEYGYGVYVLHGSVDKATVKWEDLACSGDLNPNSTTRLSDLINDTGKYNEAASDALAEQMKNTDGNDSEYSFFAFTTCTEDDPSDSYLYLDGGIGDDARQNGAVTLSFESDSGATVTDYCFKISPFFANAMSVESITSKTGTQDTEYTPAKVEVTCADERIRDYRLEPGTVEKETVTENGKTVEKIKRANQYETRSLQQLQYINWNAETKSCNELVKYNEYNSNDPTLTNWNQFPYLQYASKFDADGSGQFSSVEDVIKGSYSREDKAGVINRADLCWLQTHDIEEINADGDFTPIAGTLMSSQQWGDYTTVLYTWFGSSYCGQNYAIKNINIHSNSFNVGLFGTTVRANIEDVVMSCDSSATWTPTIERVTDVPGEEQQVGARAIGGLIGVAYDSGSSEEQAITNCAISGYLVRDGSTDKQALGETNVGGLIGVANTNVNSCEAVTYIVLDSYYAEGTVSGEGIFIRVGGITGATQGEIKDCYSGGSCTITEGMRNQEVGYGYAAHRFEIFIGGIAGSGFTSNYKNFSNTADYMDGEPTVSNCYTFFEFPENNSFHQDSGERKLVMYTITSMADRYSAGKGKKATVNNCYYLDSVVNNNRDVTRTFPIADKTFGSGYEDRTTVNTLEPVSYDNMVCTTGNTAFVSSLNKNGTTAWAPVSIKDKKNEDISGKFSYPSSEVLEGKNYPFPTIVTQNDLTYGNAKEPYPVHVHYGNWPLNGSYWAKGRDTMDIFSDMSADKWAYQDFELYVDKSKFYGGVSDVANALFVGSSGTSKSDDYAEIAGVSSVSTGDKFDVYRVKVKAKKEGMTTIGFRESEGATNDPNDDVIAFFTLQITANWLLSAQAADSCTVFDSASQTLWIEKYDEGGKTAQLDLIASSTDEGDARKYYSTDADWQKIWPAPSVDDTVEIGFDVLSKNRMKVTRTSDGSLVLAVTARYDYNSSNGGEVFTKQLFINIEEPSMVGISNAVEKGGAQEGSNYNEVTLGRDSNQPQQGRDDYYNNEAVSKPLLVLDSTGTNNFFLYTAAGNNYLMNPANIVSIEVADGDYSQVLVPGEPVPGKRFYLEIDNDTSTDEVFTYLAGTLFYVDNKPTNDEVTLTVTLQAGYKLSISIPKNWVKEKDFNKLILHRGTKVGDMTKRFTIMVDGITELSSLGYVTDDFEQFGCTLEGWYSSADDSGKKILNPDGTICDGDAPGYTSEGAFNLATDMDLYAKWTFDKPFWVPANTIESGKRYIIVNSNTVTADARIAYYEEDDPYNAPAYTPGEGNRGVYLSNKAIEIKANLAIAGTTYDVYIDEGVVEGSIWTASDSSQNEWKVLNGAYHGYVLAENDCRPENYWVTLAADPTKLANNYDSRKHMKLDNGLLRCEQAGLVNFIQGTTTLGCGSGTSGPLTYLFVEVTHTFGFGEANVLTLMDRGVVVGSTTGKIDNSSAGLTDLVGSITPPTTSTTDWIFQGWYDGDTKLFDASGTLVNVDVEKDGCYEVKGNKLTVSAPLTLYAKGLKKVNNAYVKVDALTSGGVYVVAANTTTALTADANGQTAKTTALTQKTNVVDQSGNVLSGPVVINESAKCLWTVQKNWQGDLRFYYSSGNSYLNVNNGNNATPTLGSDWSCYWNITNGKLSRAGRGLKPNGSEWIVSNGEGADITFYVKNDNVYELTTRDS